MARAAKPRDTVAQRALSRLAKEVVFKRPKSNRAL